MTQISSGVMEEFLIPAYITDYFCFIGIMSKTGI
jgi:hypothetical protein